MEIITCELEPKFCQANLNIPVHIWNKVFYKYKNQKCGQTWHTAPWKNNINMELFSKSKWKLLVVPSKCKICSWKYRLCHVNMNDLSCKIFRKSNALVSFGEKWSINGIITGFVPLHYLVIKSSVITVVDDLVIDYCRQHNDNVNYLCYIPPFHIAMPEAFRHSTLHASLQCVNTHYVNKTHFHNRFALVTSRRLKRSCTLDFLFFFWKNGLKLLFFSVFLCYFWRGNAAGPSPTCSPPTPPLLQKKTHLLQRFLVSLRALMTTHIQSGGVSGSCCKHSVLLVLYLVTFYLHTLTHWRLGNEMPNTGWQRHFKIISTNIGMCKKVWQKYYILIPTYLYFSSTFISWYGILGLYLGFRYRKYLLIRHHK